MNWFHLAIPLKRKRIEPPAVPWEEVELIFGESGNGITASSGQLFIWKRTIVVAGDRRFVMSGDDAANRQNFDSWMRACPNAVGVRPDGFVVFPKFGGGVQRDAKAVLAAALAVAKRELPRRIKKTLGIVVAATIAGIAWAIVLPMTGDYKPDELSGNRWFIGTALVAFDIPLCVRCLIFYIRKRRVVRILNDAIAKGGPDVNMLSQDLAPRLTIIQESIRPAFISILSLLVCLMPFIGLFFSVIAVGVTFRRTNRRRSWTRVLAITSLIVSLIMIGIVIVSIIQSG